MYVNTLNIDRFLVKTKKYNGTKDFDTFQDIDIVLYKLDVSTLSETKEIYDTVKNLVDCATFTDANSQFDVILNESF